MKRVRLAWAMGMLAALLLVGCARSPGREPGASPLDPIQQAIAEAGLAVEAVQTAAQKGDLAAARAAYQRFSEAFGQLLGPVSMEDALLAQKMANANSAMKEMLAKGKVDPAMVQRELSAIRQGLQASTGVMARAQGEPGLARGEAAPATAGRAEGISGMEQKFNVVAVDFKLQPGQIRVKRGTRVTIRLENKGTQRHEFEVPDFDFEIGPLEPGQVLEKSFVASKEGVFPYECHVDDHLQKGMKGILIVEK